MAKVPEILGSTGAAWYRRVRKKYTFDPHELEILSVAAQTLDRIETARVSIAENGLLVSDQRGALKKNPACEIESSAKKTFLDFCKALKIFTEGDKDGTAKK